MAEKQENPGPPPSFVADFSECWKQLPNKGLFFALLAAWVLLFQFLGNATFGYINTPSIFRWLYESYNGPNNDGQDQHGNLVPLVVLALFWWKRKELLALSARSWWPGLLGVAFALALHTLAYLVQQPLGSVAAFFIGLYSLMGLAWGPLWLRASFFPFFLFIFSIPLSSNSQIITFPLRIMVSKLVTFICGNFLGIDIVRRGTQLFNAAQTYSYDVAAACSGLRSVIAILALCMVFAFVTFSKNWKRLVMIAAAIPLAVLGNTIRLMCIIIAAETNGQAGGNFVHENWFFSLLPYVPAFGGVLLLGHWLRDRQEQPEVSLSPKTA
jgi:exosortase